VAKDFWITEKTNAMFVYLFEAFTQGTLWHKAQGNLFFISLLLTTFALSPIIMRVKQLHREEKLLIFLSVVPIILTYITSQIFHPLFQERYLISSLPFFFLIIAFGINTLWEKREYKIPIIIILLLYFPALFTSVNQITNLSTKPAINWAVSQVVNQSRVGDIVIAESQLNFLETKWYIKANHSNLATYVITDKSKFPYFLGSSVIEKGDILSATPSGRTIWYIQTDGGYRQVYYVTPIKSTQLNKKLK
jgi:hypothetical protein